MKPQYEPKTLQQKLGYLIEECGEVQAAVGKTIRWGIYSVNPELPPESQEKNGDWILRELNDLERAIKYAREAIATELRMASSGTGRGMALREGKEYRTIDNRKPFVSETVVFRALTDDKMSGLCNGVWWHTSMVEPVQP